MENATLWTRRTNTSKLSLSMSNTDNKDNSRTDSPRTFSKRYGSDVSMHGRSNPFNAMSPLTTSLASPSTGASSAFGLGSGAFASFGSAKTPKTPSSESSNTITNDRKGKDSSRVVEDSKSRQFSTSVSGHSEHVLKSTWVIWYRPPTSKYSDYEKSTIAIASFATAESFWTIYSHLKRPSQLPSVSDYHIFKKGIRPVWEDEENRRGGKWIVRLKKGVADRYWEDLLLIMIGDQFAEAGEEVCGAVLSVRSGEDVLSVWTRIDGGRNIKIRETIKRLLAFLPDTNIVWKSHDDSIAQRTAIDQARQEKIHSNSHQISDKRRNMSHDETAPHEHKSLNS